MTAAIRRPAPVDLTLVMGFPGAGKSRFITEAAAAAPERIAGILDEAATTRRTATGAIVETAGHGCLCCAGATELQATLEDLLRRRDNGRMPPITQVLVELDGLADPLPPLAGVLRHPYLSLRYRPTGMIALIDPRVPLHAVRAVSPAWRQLTLAACHHRVAGDASVDSMLRAACPAALPLADPAALPPLDPAGWDEADRRRWLALRLGGTGRARPGASAADHESFGFEEHRFTLPPARSPADLAMFVEQFGARFGESLLRLKGQVALEGAPQSVVRIEAGCGWFAPPEVTAQADMPPGLILRAPSGESAGMQLFITGHYPSSR